jgi:TolB-like protein
MPEDRRLAAIMFTDIVGYTALMGADEDRAIRILKINRKIHQQQLAKFNGTLIKEMGDGMLARFNLASDAARCAVNIQKECIEENIPLRIGIHEGETIFIGADVFGDGVNIASRIQSESQSGCITISETIYRNIKNKTDLETRFIKKKSYKNVDEPIKIYQLLWGGEKEKSVNIPGFTKRKKNLLLGLSGIAIIIIAIMVARPFLIPQTNLAIERSIAVLPFENQSEENEYAYFGDALTDEIIMQLQKIKDFKVRSNTSVMKYKGSDLTTPEIADELQVNYIIEGTAQRFQNNVRIRVQLIDAITDEHVWGETYNRAWGDIFTLQGDIAMKIADELETLLSHEEIRDIQRKPTENLAAYEYYLKAQEFHSGFSFDYTKMEINNAIIFYKKALELDPEFGLAYVGLGCAKFNLTHWDEFYQDSYGDSLLWYVNKALSFDPDLPEALLWKGIYYYVKGDIDSALILYRQILNKQPNYNDVYLWLVMAQVDGGYYLEAIINSKKADKLLIADPQYGYFLSYYFAAYYAILDVENAEKIAMKRMDYNVISSYNNLLNIYNCVGDIKKMEEVTYKMCAIDSTSCTGWLGQINILFGNYEKAWEYYQKAEKLMNKPARYGMGKLNRKAFLLTKINRMDEAKPILNNEIDDYLKQINLGRALDLETKYNLASCYAILGEKEKCYEILDQFDETLFPGYMVGSIQVNPMFENLWEDEEFKAIVSRQEKKYAEIRAEIDSLEKVGVL